MEAMIPPEIGSPSRRTSMSGDESNADLRLHLNLLEERREVAAIREATYKRQMEKYYNARVKERRFKIGDWVLRSNEASMQENQGNLGPRWEGPYQITWAEDRGSYLLANPDNTAIPRTWNAMQLKKYYIVLLQDG
jgi:hypothetical protein